MLPVLASLRSRTPYRGSERCVQVAGPTRSVQTDTFAAFWAWSKFELVAAVLRIPHALTVLTLPLLVLAVLLLLC